MQLTYPLDEFYPFATADGLAMQVIVYGEAMIEYGLDGEWRIAEIELDVSTMQRPYKTARRAIDEAHPLYTPIKLALIRDRSEEIREDVLEALAAIDIALTCDAAEHSTLNHAQTGIAVRAA